MNPNPEAQSSIPTEDQEPIIDSGGGHSIFSFGDILRKIVMAKPMLLPLVSHYGFNDKTPLFRSHRHLMDDKGEDLGFREWTFGTKSILVYPLFLIELLIKLVIAALYLISLVAILLIVLRAVELPDYVFQIWHQDIQHLQTVDVRVVK